jgi:hypothetical protein
MPREKAAARAGVSVEDLVRELSAAAMGAPTDQLTWRTKLRATELLGKHLGMFQIEIPGKNGQIIVLRVDEDDRNA